MKLPAIFVTAVFLTTTGMGTALALDEGPYEYDVFNVAKGTGGATEGGKLVVPTEAGSYPLLIISHGWGSSSAYMVGWGKLFASYGYVAVMPNFPTPMMPQHDKNRQIVEGLAAYYRDPPADSPAFGKVDDGKTALLGHSGGGLASALADSVVRPNVSVFFDPVDHNNLARKVLPDRCGPALEMFTAPSMCNDQLGWQTGNPTGGGDVVRFRLVGSNHCDGERPARQECGPFCGGAPSAVRQDVFATYGLAMLEWRLKGDDSQAGVFEEELLNLDEEIHEISLHPGSDECADVETDTATDTEPDTATDTETETESDTGTGESDSGTGADTGSETEVDTEPTDPLNTDSGTSSTSGETPAEDDGGDGESGGDASCSCSAVGVGASPLALWLLGLFTLGGTAFASRRRD